MPDGRIFPFMHHIDLSMPYLMMVDQNGKRFADEAGAYMEIGERLFQRHRDSGGRGIPAWVIFDKRNRERYPWGTSAPGVTPQSWLDSGYMKKADTLEALAAICGIDAAGLQAEVTRFNVFCRTGVDTDTHSSTPQLGGWVVDGTSTADGTTALTCSASVPDSAGVITFTCVAGTPPETACTSTLRPAVNP